MASVGMEMMAEWGCEAIQQRLRMLTGQLADELRNEAVTLPDASVRAPHILSPQFRGGMPERLVQQLAAEGIYVAPRVGRMRISPHVYNDEADIDRFVATFRRLARVN
jgi:selenocysteine lyase/cysteine desulfurase